MNAIDALIEKDRIVDAVTELFMATDRRDWAAVREVLAPEVLFDMSSLTGAPAATMSGAQIAAAWEEGLRPIQAVHHQAGNFQTRVRGDEADVRCYATATHYLPNPTGHNLRTFVGSYVFGLRKSEGRWRITLFRFLVKYLDGNLELEKSARG